ncbi:MAG: TRAP transporter large permease subunit, partial [Pseudomonadota bacterium]
AALIPGVLAALGYMIAISCYARFAPGSGSVTEPAPFRQRFRALAAIWPVMVIFVAVVGGIYAGVFTPTEAAAIGAAGTGLVALFNGGLTRQSLVGAILATASSTAMIFFIILGAGVFNAFLASTQLPQLTAAYIGAQGFSPWWVLTAVLIMYLVFGCVMDSLSMIVLTVPIFFPILAGLDFGLAPTDFALWFGVLVLIVVEVGLITPPVGLNLFVINRMATDVPIAATFRGVIPFVASDLLRVAILALFPGLTLALVWLVY